MQNEEWRDIPGYEGYYQASNLGRIRSLTRKVTQRHPNGTSTITRTYEGRVLVTAPYSGERKRVRLSCEGVQEQKSVAVLVALAFHGVPKPGKDWALHRNGNMFDDRADNLYWGDQVDNMQDAIRHGTHYGRFKTQCRNGHDLRGPNLQWNATLGSRYCRACQNANAWVRGRRVNNGETITPEEKRAYADKRYAEIMAEE
ncbi:HNH endonuclease [Mycobacterium phage KashFlow]|nr:HNH endonuclease [Mycobacterium phage KashFlow]